VKQLRGHDKGRTLEVIMKTLKEIGYKNVQYTLLKARDFGLPQNRERLYIVGFLDDDVLFEFPKPLELETRVGDVLEQEVDEKYTISDRLWAGHQRRKIENRRKGKGFGYSMFTHDSPYTSTISARYYKDGSEILIAQEGKNPRKVTPREASRLQGFPEDFKIPVSDTQAYQQFGNTVPVKVIEAIAKEMLVHLS
jgi:DNA (cytosine-5)-methyltransferase 1